MLRQFSAGGVIYKESEKGRLWLMRKPMPNPEYKGTIGWTFPKGWIDSGETPEQAAVREVREEAGVEAEIVSKLPTFKVFFTNESGEKVMKFITYYVMKWQRDLPEGFGNETSEVLWETAEAAEAMLVFRQDKKMLLAATESVRN